MRYRAPRVLFSFNDLVKLAAIDPPPPDVQARLDALRSQPFISNEATFSGTRPLMPEVSGVGRVLRLAEWNINREENESMMLALSDARGFESLVRENQKLNPKFARQALDEMRQFQEADVIVLNEVDMGVNRTGYRDVTRDIATRLHMNYVFATEFVELTPLYLGFHNMDTVDLPRQHRGSERFGVDPRRYLGLEGSALLSRYPIRSARIMRLPEAYDWYHGEIGAISELQKMQKWSAEKLFNERLSRQVRRGGRIAILVELEIPGKGSRVLTVVCPHLEDYAGPKGRRRQMDAVLEEIGGISTPLLMAGDLNTTGHNGRPITVKRELKKYLLNYKFWVRTVFYEFAPLPIPGVNYAVAGVNYYKNKGDPTAVNIPILAANGEKHLFNDVHKFRFDDGSSFDWGGDKDDSYHHKGHTLSVTNQRQLKGFVPTFGFARNLHGMVGSYKLDWIMVKRSDEIQPHDGKTLREMNLAPQQRISDHAPTMVDLSLPR